MLVPTISGVTSLLPASRLTLLSIMPTEHRDPGAAATVNVIGLPGRASLSLNLSSTCIEVTSYSTLMNNFNLINTCTHWEHLHVNVSADCQSTLCMFATFPKLLNCQFEFSYCFEIVFFAYFTTIETILTLLSRHR